MLLLIVLFPFLGFLLSIVFGRFLGAAGVTRLTTAFIGISFVLSVLGFFNIALNQTVIVYDLFAWFSTSLIFSNLGFYVR